MPYWFEQLTEPVQELVIAAQEMVGVFNNNLILSEVLDDSAPIEKLRTALENLGG